MDFSNNDYVFKVFKKLVEEKGFEIDRVDEDDWIHLSKSDYEIKVSLDNLRKEYRQIKEDYCIENFVDAIGNTGDDLPEWGKAKKSIFPSLFPSNFEFGDYIKYPITDEFNMIFVYDSGTNKTWINEEQLQNWSIDNQTILQVAYNNLDRVLETADLEIDMIDDKKLAYFSLDDETMKSVLVLSKKLKKR